MRRDIPAHESACSLFWQPSAEGSVQVSFNDRVGPECRNPLQLKGLCKGLIIGTKFLLRRNTSQLKGLCKRGYRREHDRDGVVTPLS